MALPPHFGGIENEARTCNIYHHRLQNTPIKILLHEITIIFSNGGDFDKSLQNF